jgi:hypothetical protein
MSQSEIMEAMGFRTVYTKHVTVRTVSVTIQLHMPHESDKGEVYMVTAHAKSEDQRRPPRYAHTEPRGFRTLEEAVSAVDSIIVEAVNLATGAERATWIAPELAKHWHETVSVRQMSMEF